MKYGCGMVIVETNISMNGMHYELVFEQNVNVSVIPRQAGRYSSFDEIRFEQNYTRFQRLLQSTEGLQEVRMCRKCTKPQWLRLGRHVACSNP